MIALVVIGLLIAVVLNLGVGVFIGMVLCSQGAADDRVRLVEREAQLQAEWDNLREIERDNAVFWEARIAMRNEALQHRSTTVFQYGTPR